MLGCIGTPMFSDVEGRPNQENNLLLFQLHILPDRTRAGWAYNPCTGAPQPLTPVQLAAVALEQKSPAVVGMRFSLPGPGTPYG
jgi:hypothetical protein